MRRNQAWLNVTRFLLGLGLSSAWTTSLAPFRHQRSATIQPRSRPTKTRLYLFPFTKAARETPKSSHHDASSSSLVLYNITDHVGSGSYGTVHQALLGHVNNTTLDDNLQDPQEVFIQAIAKRSWTLTELQQKYETASLTPTQRQEKYERCVAYLQAEAHCLQKLSSHANIPTYRGMLRQQADHDSYTWLVTDLIPASDDNPTVPAPSLADILALETQTRNSKATSSSHDHHLGQLAAALGLDSSTTLLVDTLDVVLTQLLECLAFVHSKSIVHRDIKPANVLVSATHGKDGDVVPRLTLIDFGSAADLEHPNNGGLLGRLLSATSGSPDTVAVSPVYAAPEVFVDASMPRMAMTFDCFSLALLYLQLLFQYTDDRTDAGFRQQLLAVDWDLNTWMDAQLQSKVAPVGLPEALDVLRERPGLWALLQNMLRPNPNVRITSIDALDYWTKIRQSNVKSEADGPFLNNVLASMEQCVIPTVRPLQFVASFQRSSPLGLVLAEAVGTIDDTNDRDMELETLQIWEQATSDALPGEVFVKGIVQGSQADQLGIFEIGDRLLGIGELPVGQGGFEAAVAMLQEQPKSAKYVTLHFDRRSRLAAAESVGAQPVTSDAPLPIPLVDSGAWSMTGRRAAQEDTFVLSEIHDNTQRSIRIAAILDGHLGAAASSFVRDHLAPTFSQELSEHGSDPTVKLLEATWNELCDSYRRSCEEESCTADYDPMEGRLQAFTGSNNVVAGTTAVMIAYDAQERQLSVLNCGDSRGVVVNKEGEIVFATQDHSPGTELQRFEQGILDGMPYKLPECSLSRWTVPVGDYNYAVSRSLEGSFATSRGIVSSADIARVPVEPGLTAVLATDGLWEVIDSQEAASILQRLRYRQNELASDAAKILTSLAIAKGSSDNVSVIVLYL